MTPRAIIAFVIMCLMVLPAVAQSQKKESAQKKEAAAQKKEGAAPADDPVVARVNGAPIFRSDLAALRATLPPQLAQQPPEQLYPRLVEQMVAMTLVTQAARKEKLDEDPRVKKMEMLSDENILQQAYFEGIMRKQITEAALKQRYDDYVKNAPPQEEVHARHILVASEAEAKDIIEQLKKGADFAKLASEKTTDPSGKASGGDLGYFTAKDMVPEFSKAAFALKPGEFTQEPVKTQFGWHIIKVEDRRPAKAPTYEESAPQLAHQMQEEIYQAKVKELQTAARIEVFNADGSKPTPAPAPAPAAAAPAAAAPAAAASPNPAAAQGQPQPLPLQNGNPSGPAVTSAPPTLAPATQDMDK